jgi:cation:H+ antiporter
VSALASTVAGLALLLIGGEILVRGATGTARALGVSPLLIGLTLVGFGTSSPELVTSFVASLQGSPGIAVGNAVGSNIANILFVLGVSAVLSPLAVDPRGFRRDAVAMVAAAAALLGATFAGGISRPVGLMFLSALVAYLAIVYRQERRSPDAEGLVKEHIAADAPSGFRRPIVGVSAAVVGIALTIAGAHLLVKGAITIARVFGIPETIIGLTVVAVGTSLPELVTSVVAARRGHADVAYGNIVGSNIYNILFILGACALASPLEIPAQIRSFDIWVMLAATVALLVSVRIVGRLSRWNGVAFVLAYATYIAVLAGLA